LLSAEVEEAVVIRVDNPAAPAVLPLIESHLAFARSVTPPEHIHALTADRLIDPAVTFLTASVGDARVGMAALKRLSSERAEIKSMHVLSQFRGRKVGVLLVERLIQLANEWGCREMVLETGAKAAFEPARRLYKSFGFAPCPPFPPYTENPYSMCMRLTLTTQT
jgi:putative acetyltransferase